MATQVQKLVEPYVDLGNLLLIDRDPLDVVALKDDNDGLAKLAQQNVQFLYNKIWELPRKVVEDATCAQVFSSPAFFSFMKFYSRI
jgi:hypothetical protein